MIQNHTIQSLTVFHPEHVKLMMFYSIKSHDRSAIISRWYWKLHGMPKYKQNRKLRINNCGHRTFLFQNNFIFTITLATKAEHFTSKSQNITLCFTMLYNVRGGFHRHEYFLAFLIT